MTEIKPKKGTYTRLAKRYRVSVNHVSEAWRGNRVARTALAAAIEREKKRQTEKRPVASND